MINLLPKRYHAELASAYRLHVATVLLWGIVLVLLVANVLFGGFWLLVRKERLNWQRLEEQAKEQSTIVSEKKQVPANLDTPKNLGQAIDFIKKLDQPLTHPTYVLDRLLVDRSSGIKFNELVYLKDGTNKVTVSVSGNHLGRQTLVAFVDRLKVGRNWSVVDVPLSNFIKETAGEFAIKLQAAPNRQR